VALMCVWVQIWTTGGLLYFKMWVVSLPGWKVFTSHKLTLLHGVNLLGFDKGKRRQYTIFTPQLKTTIIS
jgi:hypothetical protein